MIEPGFAGFFRSREDPVLDLAHLANEGSNPRYSPAGTDSVSMIQRAGTALPFQAYTCHPSRNTTAGPSSRCGTRRSLRWISDGLSARSAACSYGHHSPDDRAISPAAGRMGGSWLSG